MDDFDKAIDGVVRRMLDADPPPELRERVLDRIARPDSRFPLRWALAPIAAAALLIVALLIPWRTSQTTLPTIRGTSVAAAVPTIHASLPRGTKQEQPARAPRVVADVKARAGASRIQPDDRAPESHVAPLAALHAIEVAPVSVSRLDAQQVAIAPLPPIEQIEIQPVGPPEGR